MSKELRFLQITAKHQEFLFYHISNDKSFTPKYPNPGGGGTLGIAEWGCAAGTLES